jgi:cell division protein FtsA
MQHYIVGLDIGSRNIKVVVGEVRKGGQLSVMRVFKAESAGVRKGAIDDLGEATRAVNAVLADVKKVFKNGPKNIFLGVGSSGVKTYSSTGVVAVSRSDSEIYQDDIARAIQGSQAINLPPNRMILHSVVREFIVDNMRDIRDPLGMIGNRLEVNSLIIDVFAPAVKNLEKCVEVSGGEISGLIFTPIADARSVLTKSQRELGVVVVDVGFGKTGMSVYEESKLLHAAVFPVGASNVTNDLAIGLKISVETAETIKLSYGCASAKEVSSKESVDLSKIDETAKGMISKKFIAEIIEVRLAEIFELVDNELKRIGKSGRLPSGVILTGGGAKLPGIVELAKKELKLSAQIGIPQLSGLEVTGGELGSQIEDPEFVSVIGVLMSGSDRLVESKSTIHVPVKSFFKSIFKHLAP